MSSAKEVRKPDLTKSTIQDELSRSTDLDQIRAVEEIVREGKYSGIIKPEEGPGVLNELKDRKKNP